MSAAPPTGAPAAATKEAPQPSSPTGAPTVDSVLTQIWSALPSINALPADGRADATAVRDDISAFAAALHRAVHANANEDESVKAAPTMLESAGIKADETTFNVARFVDFAQVLIGKTIPSFAGPLTLALAESIRECLVDDRAPQALVPLAAVMSLSSPHSVTIPTTIDQFLKLSTFAEHAAVYDTIWKSLSVQPESNGLPEAEFARFFRQIMRYAYANATAKRSDAAAHTVFLDAIAPTCSETMSFDLFIRTAQRQARIHLSPDSPDEGLTACVAFLSQHADSAHGLWECEFVSPALRGNLGDPEANYVPSDLDPEYTLRNEVLSCATKNRLLVSGVVAGTSTVAANIAKKLNCVHVDVFDLCTKASDDSKSAHSATIKQLVAEGKAIPLALQAQLVAECLKAPSTVHRGYVFSDIPVASQESIVEVEAFVKACGLAADTPPQGVVRVTAPADKAIANSYLQQDTNAWRATIVAEMAQRDAETNEEKRKAQAIEDKAERNRKRERRAERRTKIDAGELQPAEEDAPDPVLDEPEPEEQPEVDENGTPLEPEQIAAKHAARVAAINRRRFLFDLRMAIVAGRPNVDGLDANQLVAGAELPCLGRVVSVASERHHVVALSCFDSQDASCADLVESRLRLLPSVVPLEPTLQPGEADGIEPGPDGDAALGEMKLRSMTEAGLLQSPFLSNCPVTKLHRGVLVSGSWAFSCHYRGFMYCFASKLNLALFMASPNPYVLQPLVAKQPAFLTARMPSVLTDAKIDAATLERSVSEQLNLTLMTLQDFDDTWSRMLQEQERRASILEGRRAADAKTAAAREERRKKQREAEAKKKKGGAAEKKPAVKKGDKKDDAEDAEAKAAEEAAAAAAAAAPAAEDESAKVVSTEERIAKEIEAAVALAASKALPVLVSTLRSGLHDESIERMIARGLAPPSVVVLEYAKPLLPDEEPPVEEEEAEEEPAPPPAASDDPDAPPPPPAPKKVFDPTDGKQCKRLVAKLVERVTAQPDDGKPPLSAVTMLNCYAANVTDIANAAAYNINRLSAKALPPQDGEELVVDPEEEPTEETLEPKPDPALKPGKRAIHQFGTSKRFCPVTLLKSKTLVVGDPSIWMSYQGSRYLFASQAALDEFKVDPARYIPAAPSINPSWQESVLPPPRLWILGVPSSGKRTAAAHLLANHGIPLFSIQHAFLRSVAAAASSATGGSVTAPASPSAPVSVPGSQGGSKYLQAALAILSALDAAEKDEQDKNKLKADTQAAQTAREAAQEAGEEVDEMDEEEEAAIAKILEFEPEDPEAKVERVAKSMREVASQLVFVEPYLSKGYVLLGEPATEADATHLMDIGMIPETVISLKLSVENYVARNVSAIVATQTEAHAKAVQELSKKKADRQRKLRELELKRWRRRNLAPEEDEGAAADEDIGGGDDDDEAEPAPVSVDTIKEELSTQYDNDNGAIAPVLALFGDRRVPVCEVIADQGLETVSRFIENELSFTLKNRLSLLEAPMVITYDAAMDLLRLGQKHLSGFRYLDAVSVMKKRAGVPQAIAWRPVGRRIETEPHIPPPPPPPPKEKVIRMVKTVNDEGEEVEVPEEVEPEPEEVEEVPEEDEIEPEPELSPEEIEEMTKELEAKKKKALDLKRPRACVLRNRVFFFDSDANLKEFLSRPLLYWKQPPPLPETETTVAAVIEKESSVALPGGSRNMAHHLAHNVGAVYIDLTKLVRWGLDRPDAPSLQHACRRIVFDHEEASSAVVAQLLCSRLQCLDVQQRGAVLFNLPRTTEQVSSLLAAGVSIHTVLSFDGHQSDALLALDKHARVTQLMNSIPHSNAALVEIVNAWNNSVLRRQTLTHAKALGFPARLHNTATPETVFTSCRSVFGEYCPYMWSAQEELVDVGNLRTFAALHCGLVYHFSRENLLQDFLRHPERLTGEVPPKPRDIPTVLPQRAPAQPSGAVELCGCCPVVLYDTRDRKGLRGVTEPKAVAGKDEFTVKYEGKFYRLSSADATERFLRRPWVFVHGASLPAATKLPVDAAELKKASNEEFIARTLYESAARALIAAEKVRPKFPGLDAHDTCLKFIALHLKAHNPSNTEHRHAVYSKHFEAFTQRATLYKTVTIEPPQGDAEEARLFVERCAAWDAVQDNLNCHEEYGVLPKAAAAAPKK